MDRIDLDELERLAKAATPGPWEAWIMKQPLYHAIMPSDYPLRPSLGQTKHDADARFIVAACNAVPELIKMYREADDEAADANSAWQKVRRENLTLREQVRELEAELETYKKPIDFPKLREGVAHVDNSLSDFLNESIERAAHRP